MVLPLRAVLAPWAFAREFDERSRRTMKTHFGFAARLAPVSVLSRFKLLCVFFFVVLLTSPYSGFAQSAESADAGRGFLWVGVAASGYHLGYGDRRILGITGWVDADTIRRFGIEAEGRWLDWHQRANVHAETYLIGPRYHFNVGRTQPYVKALAGWGRFNFPYNYAYGHYFIIGGGGGIDYRLSRRWGARLDFEYQDWPQFTFGAMSSYGGTIGVRYRVF